MRRFKNIGRMPWMAGFLLFGAGACVAQAAKPNFSGAWTMNADKSDFGAFPHPTSRTDKIVHDDPSLRINTSQKSEMGDGVYDLSYSTDGKETTNEIRGNTVKSTGSWDGDVMVLDSKANFQGADVTFHDRWSLSEDGKTITISRHITSPQGETDQKVILEKQ